MRDWVIAWLDCRVQYNVINVIISSLYEIVEIDIHQTSHSN